ncbi:4Fe-4S dicluster domain-containing protein [Clostridium sp. AF18-27]|nr:4Fe-4S dicluster domain-containing protein [Clostridium sp. AF18-27]
MESKMENWLKDNECTGCGACQNICPKEAIQMVTDECGFWHPRIIKDKCIDCKQCEKVCPIVKPAFSNRFSSSPEVYAGWSLNADTRYNSTSGGIFSELALKILEMGGAVSGAVYSETFLVYHQVIFKETDLTNIRQSKYIQSDSGYVFREIKTVLAEGKTVLFCGTPCQVAGLNTYLGKDYENLITVDFICRGANSPKAYRKWLDMLEKQYHSEVTRVWFKNKELGWNRFSTRVDFKNGKIYRKDRYTDLFMRGYLEKNWYIRPCCGDCKFKAVPRVADLTLADFWKVDKALDEDKGTSMIMVNTQRGTFLLESIKDNIYLQRRDLDEVLNGNQMLNKSAWISKWSGYFLRSLDYKRFDKAFYHLELKLKFLGWKYKWKKYYGNKRSKNS